MTITIDDEKLNGLNAVVAKLNAEKSAAATDENPAVLVTPSEYLTARIEETLANYDRQLIEETKKAFDDMFTLAATFNLTKREILIAKVQELAAS